MSEGNIEWFFFGAAVVQRSAMTTDEALIKSSYESVYYTYISGLMLTSVSVYGRKMSKNTKFTSFSTL